MEEKKRNNAVRKWRLVKNVIRFARKSSLTEEEADFLHATQRYNEVELHPIGEKLKTTSSSSEDVAVERHCPRRKLRESICMHSGSLTPAENSFLGTLLKNPHVSVDHLEKTVETLLGDSLFQVQEEEYDSKHEDEEIERVHEGKERMKGSRPLVNDNDSLRIELWKLRHASTTVKVEIEEEKIADDAVVEETVEKDGWFEDVSFCQNFCGGDDVTASNLASEKMSDEEEKNEETTSMSIPRIQFTIITDIPEEEHKAYVLTPPLMDTLRSHMPYAVREDNYWLKYSMYKDGSDIQALLGKLRNSARSILAIQTANGEVFGSFTSSPWRNNGNNYYGSGESFLWKLKAPISVLPCSTAQEQASLESDVEVFPWSGQNHHVQLCNRRKLVVGGGAPSESRTDEIKEFSFGLALDSDLSNGTTGDCWTFNSPKLTQVSDDIFHIVKMEVWTMTPVDNLVQAERLELGRHFIFDTIKFKQA